MVCRNNTPCMSAPPHHVSNNLSAFFEVDVQVHVHMAGGAPLDPEVMVYKIVQTLKLRTAHKMHKVDRRKSLCKTIHQATHALHVCLTCMQRTVTHDEKGCSCGSQ